MSPKQRDDDSEGVSTLIAGFSIPSKAWYSVFSFIIISVVVGILLLTVTACSVVIDGTFTP